MSTIFQKRDHKTSTRVMLGAWGEDVAVQFLKQKGYKILCRHFTARIGELDIVAKKDGTYVFVEVKTRSSARFGTPEEAMNRGKQERVRKTTELYLLKNHCGDVPYQIDTIAIEYDPKTQKVQIRHIEHCM